MGLRGNRSVPRISSPLTYIDRRRVTEFVRLDLLFLGRTEDHSRALKIHIESARLLTDESTRLNIGTESGLPSWRRSTDTNPEYKKTFIETLACLLECGATWIEKVAQKIDYSKSMPLQIAVHSLSTEEPEKNTLYILTGLRTEDGRKIADHLLLFVHHLLLWSLPWYSGGNMAAWKPLLITTKSCEKLLTFSLIDQINGIAVPTALLADAYDFLPRIWILGPRSADESEGYTILGKSRMYGGVSIAGELSGTWQRRESQEIYGPP